jgi:hypothetical protein
MRKPFTGKPDFPRWGMWLGLMVLASVLPTACNQARLAGGSPKATEAAGDPNTVELLFTYGSEKEEWMKDVTAAYNADFRRGILINHFQATDGVFLGKNRIYQPPRLTLFLSICSRRAVSAVALSGLGLAWPSRRRCVFLGFGALLATRSSW